MANPFTGIGGRRFDMEKLLGKPRAQLAGNGSGDGSEASAGHGPAAADETAVDLERRRDQLTAKVAELQWDLGGLVYEMAIRDRVRVDIIVKRAAELQDADAELSEIERIVALEHSATAGLCGNCAAPHSTGAAYCWQCGQPILRQVDTSSILAP
jgi:chorismate mutase